MNTPKHTNLVKKTAVLFGAIAAGSFLGLPVLAQVDAGSSPASGQTPVECVPSTTQSNTSSSTSVNRYGSTYGASDATGVPANQISPPGTTGQYQGSTGMSNQSSQMQSDRSTAGGEGFYSSVTAPNSRADRVQYGDVLSTGGATTGGESLRILRAASDSSRQVMGAYGGSYNQSQMNTSGNTLSRTPATTGGDARQSLENSSMTTTQSYSRSTTSSMAAGMCPPGYMPSNQSR